MKKVAKNDEYGNLHKLKRQISAKKFDNTDTG